MSVMNKLLANTNWMTYTGRLHVGIDLLVSPPVLCLVDDVDYRVHERQRLPARPDELIKLIKAAGSAIADVVVLARRDGYALVDRIAAAGIKVHLLTPAELRRYAALKNVTDKHDAYWMTHLLRAGAMPMGEVYWGGEIRDIHPHPVSCQTSLPSLSSRLKIKHPQVVELGGNRRFFSSRKH